jgi:putative FmdB family regulatory protein
MPIFEYVCGSCSCEFEELKTAKDTAPVVCKNCGAQAERKMSRFASVVAGGSSNEPIDMTVGRAANDRWQMYHDRRNKRRGDLPLTPIDVPMVNGKYQPVMALGDGKDRETRKEFVTALREENSKRAEKVQPVVGQV